MLLAENSPNSSIEQKHGVADFPVHRLTDKARVITRNRSFDEWSCQKSFLLNAYSERRTEHQWQLKLHSHRQTSGETVMYVANENCYIKLITL